MPPELIQRFQALMSGVLDRRVGERQGLRMPQASAEHTIGPQEPVYPRDLLPLRLRQAMRPREGGVAAAGINALEALSPFLSPEGISGPVSRTARSMAGVASRVVDPEDIGRGIKDFLQGRPPMGGSRPVSETMDWGRKGQSFEAWAARLRLEDDMREIRRMMAGKHPDLPADRALQRSGDLFDFFSIGSPSSTGSAIRRSQISAAKGTLLGGEKIRQQTQEDNRREGLNLPEASVDHTIGPQDQGTLRSFFDSIVETGRDLREGFRYGDERIREGLQSIESMQENLRNALPEGVIRFTDTVEDIANVASNIPIGGIQTGAISRSAIRARRAAMEKAGNRGSKLIDKKVTLDTNTRGFFRGNQAELRYELPDGKIMEVRVEQRGESLFLDWIGRPINDPLASIPERDPRPGQRIMFEIVADLEEMFPSVSKIQFDRITGMAPYFRSHDVIP